MNKEKINLGVEILETITQLMLGIGSIFLIWDTAYYPFASLIGIVLFAVVAAWVFIEFKVRKVQKNVTETDKERTIK